MVRDYRFKDIEKYLKKDADIGEDILNAFEGLTDAAIIFSPIIFGPQFLPMLELLDVKDRLFGLGHKVYDFIAQGVVILSGQLEKDLETFNAHRNDGSPKAHSYSSACKCNRVFKRDRTYVT